VNAQSFSSEVAEIIKAPHDRRMRSKPNRGSNYTAHCKGEHKTLVEFVKKCGRNGIFLRTGCDLLTKERVGPQLRTRFAHERSVTRRSKDAIELEREKEQENSVEIIRTGCNPSIDAVADPEFARERCRTCIECYVAVWNVASNRAPAMVIQRKSAPVTVKLNARESELHISQIPAKQKTG